MVSTGLQVGGQNVAWEKCKMKAANADVTSCFGLAKPPSDVVCVGGIKRKFCQVQPLLLLDSERPRQRPEVTIPVFESLILNANATESLPLVVPAEAIEFFQSHSLPIVFGKQ